MSRCLNLRRASVVTCTISIERRRIDRIRHRKKIWCQWLLSPQSFWQSRVDEVVTDVKGGFDGIAEEDRQNRQLPRSKGPPTQAEKEEHNHRTHAEGNQQQGQDQFQVQHVEKTHQKDYPSHGQQHLPSAAQSILEGHGIHPNLRCGPRIRGCGGGIRVQLIDIAVPQIACGQGGGRPIRRGHLEGEHRRGQVVPFVEPHG
mmetsp:Transcript_49788/g.108467  ORF Transcript_49788/g.108467 Transcript_49788/m.108467 type:complete len:201 (-) Transcript_49788:217-819(-)